MRCSRLYKGSPYYKIAEGYHLEVDGCIVNIRQGLKDKLGRKVTSIEIKPDEHYSGEPKWKLLGTRNNRVVQLKTVRG